MANFHRFVDPTYYLFPGESFPAVPGGTGTIGLHTYDRANVLSGGTGAGASANADGQVSGGVNEYTYWVAFGNDGTSLNTNRGFRAAFESLDVLDDVVRTSIPIVASQSGASPASTGIQIVGDVWCGDNASNALGDLVAAAQSNGDPLYNGTTRAVIVDIDNGTVSNSVVGNGWVTNPTVRFNVSIVQAYELFYGGRTTHARVSELNTERTRFLAQNVDNLRQSIRNGGIFLHGLDEMYRRSSSLTTASPSVDTPGSGSTIVRDGPAVQLSFPIADWGSSEYPDPWLAGVIARHPAYNTTAYLPNYGGDIGLLALTGARGTASTSELSARGPMRAAVASYIPRSIATDTVAGSTFTRIAAGAAATLNVGGADAARVTLTAPSYFFNGSSNTAINSDADVLEVTFPDGSVQTYIIEMDFALTSVQARLKHPSGDLASFPADTAVTVTWYSAHLLLGGTSEGVLDYYQPRELGGTHQIQSYGISGIRLFGREGDHAVASGTPAVLSTIQVTPFEDGAQTTMGLYANGNLLTDFSSAGYAINPSSGFGTGIVHHAFAHRTVYLDNGGISSGDIVHIDPEGKTNAPGTRGMGYGAICLNLVGNAGDPFEVNIDASSGVKVGTVVELFIENYGDGSDGLDVTINWQAGRFLFSDPADEQFGTSNLIHGAVVRWRLMQMQTISGSGGPVYFVERVGVYYR
jgi:hypothetical protein